MKKYRALFLCSARQSGARGRVTHIPDSLSLAGSFSDFLPAFPVTFFALTNELACRRLPAAPNYATRSFVSAALLALFSNVSRTPNSFISHINEAVFFIFFFVISPGKEEGRSERAESSRT